MITTKTTTSIQLTDIHIPTMIVAAVTTKPITAKTMRTVTITRPVVNTIMTTIAVDMTTITSTITIMIMIAVAMTMAMAISIWMQKNAHLL